MFIITSFLHVISPIANSVISLPPCVFFQGKIFEYTSILPWVFCPFWIEEIEIKKCGSLPFASVTAHHGLRAPYTLVRLPPRTQRDRTTVQHSNTAPFRSTTLYRPTCDTKPLTFAHTSNISPTHMAACLFQLYTTRMVTQVAVHGAKARARI